MFLWITDGRTEIRDATEYRGLNTIDTQFYMQQALHDGNIRIACTGPAGEEYLAIGGEAGTHYRVRRFGCDRCPVLSARVRTVTSGPYAGYASQGPEFESLYSLGSDMGIADMSACIALDRLCDELGVDTVPFGATVAMAMELYERGILKPADVDGLDLRFGNHAAAVTVLRKVAYREGVGDLLAEGSRLTARRIGTSCWMSTTSCGAGIPRACRHRRG